jgi:hypothetical protein
MQGWERSEDNRSLRNQIDVYVGEAVNGSIPQLPFSGYLAFIEKGSRKEAEAAYFERRKQLAAFCLYLQYHQKSESDYGKVFNYFQELLWAIGNESTWCVMAHLPQDKNGFTENPGRQIDLFAAETAATLAEILSIHGDIIHPFLKNQISNRITEHIFEPFLERNWWWETVQSNWSAVCCGAIGMASLQLTRGKERSRLLEKVDKGLVHYLKSFGEDGACEEGIGYWVYGFGYYIYYIDMRKELDTLFHQKAEEIDKLKKISAFPRLVQMGENSFVPFSDVPARSLLPTGLLTYLQREFGVEAPACTQITPFNFDHCYRFAHISRNLWWTDRSLFDGGIRDEAVYLSDRKWLLQRNKGYFFAVKGGHNMEQHNHNDVGSFVLAINGELFLTDLGAGCYTADYFGEKRYEYLQTRSRYHNLPLINEQEQLAISEECEVDQVKVNEDYVGITMELGKLYPQPELTSLKRTISSDMMEGEILLQDRVIAEEDISVEEGFVSYQRPTLLEEGRIIIQGEEGTVTLFYEHTLINFNLEELSFENHYGEQTVAYRIGLNMKERKKDVTFKLSFQFKSKDRMI